MAYLHRGQSVFDFDDYDPTPFSGGYDQAALYGRPKPPSDETCYPISGRSSQGDGESVYGSSYAAHTNPYLPSDVDEQRPSSGYDKPSHSTDYAGAESRPSCGTGYQSRPGYGAGDHDYVPGYGKPRPTPAWQSSYGSTGDSYGRKPSHQYDTEQSLTHDEGYGYKQPAYGRFGQQPSQEWSSGYEKPSDVPFSEVGYADYGRHSGYHKDSCEESARMEGASLASEGHHGHQHGHKHHKHHRRHEYDDE